MKMYLISDNIDTWTGMRLAGVDAEEALTFASKRFCAEQKTQSGTQVQGPAPIEKQTVREN